MAFVGLVPSEHSSGTKRAQGAITKTGNAHLRRVLVEAAWHYRHHPFVSAALRHRQRGAPAHVIGHAWTAQHRLHRRYQRFAARGKPKQHIVTAVARELTGFVWAALTQ
jgi:transposase